MQRKHSTLHRVWQSIEYLRYGQVARSRAPKLTQAVGRKVDGRSAFSKFRRACRAADAGWGVVPRHTVWASLPSQRHVPLACRLKQRCADGSGTTCCCRGVYSGGGVSGWRPSIMLTMYSVLFAALEADRGNIPDSG